MSENKNVEKIDETFKQMAELENQNLEEFDGTNLDSDGTNLDSDENDSDLDLDSDENDSDENDSEEEFEVTELTEEEELTNLFKIENYFKSEIIGLTLANKDYKKFYHELKVLGTSNVNQARILEILGKQFESEIIEE